MTKKLSQELSRTVNRILGASLGLDKFILNPQVGVHSGPVPKKSGKSSRENRGTSELGNLTGIVARGDLRQ